jgi:hypothetical protein
MNGGPKSMSLARAADELLVKATSAAPLLIAARTSAFLLKTTGS